MPLYMDVHDHVEGLTAEAVAEAHKKDLATQEKHGVHYHRQWYDIDIGNVFGLNDAPSKEAAGRVQREAHGLVADNIYEVNEGTRRAMGTQASQAPRTPTATPQTTRTPNPN